MADGSRNSAGGIVRRGWALRLGPDIIMPMADNTEKAGAG